MIKGISENTKTSQDIGRYGVMLRVSKVFEEGFTLKESVHPNSLSQLPKWFLKHISSV